MKRGRGANRGGKQKSRMQKMTMEGYLRMMYRQELRKELRLSLKHKRMPGFIFRMRFGTPESRAIKAVTDVMQGALERRMGAQGV